MIKDVRLLYLRELWIKKLLFVEKYKYKKPDQLLTFNYSLLPVVHMYYNI